MQSNARAAPLSVTRRSYPVRRYRKLRPARRGRACRRRSSRAWPSGISSARSGASDRDELLVVAHHDHRARPRRQRLAGGRARRRVEVVGGLVEQQHVVAPGDELRQRELGLLAARERVGVLEHLVAAQPEHAEQVAQRAVADRRRLAHVLEQACGPRRSPRAPARSSPTDTWSPSSTVAEVGARAAPASTLSSVVLPAPLRPMTSRRSPRPTSKRHVGEHVERAERLPELGGGEHRATGRRRLGEPHASSALRASTVLRPFALRAWRPRWSRFLATRARLAVWPRMRVGHAP